MTDYSKKSNYEISCEAGRAVSFADYLLARNEQKNYCSSWADAGPIIEKSGIGLSKQSNGRWSASQPGRLYPQYHENPLRAAMIVFLMMKDAENANPS